MNGPCLRTKPKFIRLHQMLGVSPQTARGLLEFLWDSVLDTGDPVIGDADAIEAAAGWSGEPGKLCQVLLRCGGNGKFGFIEEVAGEPGLYQLHDLMQHTPADLQRKWIRQQERLERGTTIAEIRRAAANARWSKTAAIKPQAAVADAKSCKPMQMDAVCMPAEAVTEDNAPVANEETRALRDNAATPSGSAEVVAPSNPGYAAQPGANSSNPSGMHSRQNEAGPVANPTGSQPLAGGQAQRHHRTTSEVEVATLEGSQPPADFKVPRYAEVYDYFKAMSFYGDVNEFIKRYQAALKDPNSRAARHDWPSEAQRYACEIQAQWARENTNTDDMLRLGGKKLKAR